MPTKVSKAIVTGSSSGIGQAIAQCLVGEGIRVVGLDAAAPTLHDPLFTAVKIDLLEPSEIKAVLSAHPDADALVHAAGLLRVAPLGELSANDFDLMWRLNVGSLSQMVNVLAPKMAQRGHGRIIVVGSRVAQGMAGRSQYAATKSALSGLIRSWAAELISRGVTVNTVSPAATQTAMLTDPARAASQPKLPPIGRLIQPQEIASLTAFLLSSSADAITGQDIQICGGASLPR